MRLLDIINDEIMHTNFENLPVDEIRQYINDLFNKDYSYNDILRHIKDKYGIDAMTWARHNLPKLLIDKR